MPPQDQDVGAVQRGQEFYRLKQVVQSPGDIYELDESARAIYIGPDSDIGEVQVTYYNPDEPDSLETAVVSVNGPLVGRVDSLPITEVGSTGQPARILISPVDIVDNAYTPPVSSALRQFNVPALIDLMVALKTLPAIPETRADRTLRLAQVPYTRGSAGPDDGSTDILIPIYGRRMLTVQVIAIAQVDVTISLVSLLPGAATVPRPVAVVSIPASIPPMPRPGISVVRASDAARSGFLDGATGEYNESDRVANPPTTIASEPRGMADLLLVNIKDSSGAAPPAQQLFADLFVKLADRET